MGALLATLAPVLLQALIAALGKIALDFIGQLNAQTNAKSAGANIVIAKTNQETADAEHRAADAAVNQPDVSGMLADLLAGKPL